MRLAPLALALLALPALADEPADDLLAQVDAAWLERDQPGRLDQVQGLLDQAASRAPDDYGLLWRRARLLFWKADDLSIPKEEKSRLGKACWEEAERAIAARPDGVEGWFHAAAGVGNYALGMGILRALTQGLEGKFKERLARAEALDPVYQGGAIATSWGRFYYELPWPKYDAGKSRSSLRRALERNPGNVRALVYLGELELKEGRRDEARALWERAAAHEAGAYDGPEERRFAARASELLVTKR
jgi:tetratricopeptide (TPR) repeat protein